jgi:hypothetical protein
MQNAILCINHQVTFIIIIVDCLEIFSREISEVFITQMKDLIERLKNESLRNSKR